MREGVWSAAAITAGSSWARSAPSLGICNERVFRGPTRLEGNSQRPDTADGAGA